jgi:large-conductance mechanosensitive channel
MSSPFMDYLNAQGVINLALFLGPVLGKLVKDIIENIIKPISQNIYFTSGDVADKQIKLKEMLQSLVKNVITIAILTLVWMIIYRIFKMIN